MDKSSVLPHAIANEQVTSLGRDWLAVIFGTFERYFELERMQQAAYMPQLHSYREFSSTELWRLVDTGKLDVSRNEFRMVKTDKAGFNCLESSAYTKENGVLVDPGKVRLRFNEGATMAVQLLDRHHRSSNKLCTALSAYLGHPCQASAYLTPGKSQGLNVHHDTHDVVVLQIEGEKRFYLYPQVIERPLQHMHLDAEIASKLQPCASFLLRAGDVLYLPRGVPHSAEAGADGSLHLTLGILSVTWASLIARLADELYFVDYLNRSCLAQTIFDPAALRADAQVAAQELAKWIVSFGAERLASLAVQRFVDSFAMRCKCDNSALDPVAALDPDPFGGAHIVTPCGSRQLDAKQLSLWYEAELHRPLPRQTTEASHGQYFQPSPQN